MTFKIVIVDDSDADSAAIRSLSSEWASSRGLAADISVYRSSEEFLFRWEEDKTADLLLLDVEMAGMSGVSLAKTIREENNTVNVIFITGYSDYIADGYDVAALNCLIKPPNKNKFFESADRALERTIDSMKRLTVRSADGIERIPIGDIVFLEVYHNYVTIHADRVYTVKQTLKTFEAELNKDRCFFRVGRSYIINLRFIKNVSKTDVFFTDGSSVPLPRGTYEPLCRAIIDRL